MPRIIIFVIIGFVLWGINALGVKVAWPSKTPEKSSDPLQTYGIIESIGGAIKGLNAIAGGCFLWASVARGLS